MLLQPCKETELGGKLDLGVLRHKGLGLEYIEGLFYFHPFWSDLNLALGTSLSHDGFPAFRGFFLKFYRTPLLAHEMAVVSYSGPQSFCSRWGGKLLLRKNIFIHI